VVPVPNWNQNSRLALIMSVVNRHQLTIDAYQGITGDKARYHGHYYSDKAPGTALLGVPVYALLSGLQHLDRRPQFTRRVRYPLYLTTLGAVALPAAALCALLYYLLLLLSGRRLWAVALSLCYGLGALAFPFSTLLFEHQDTAACAFAAFVALVKARRSARSARWLLAGGLLVGLAVLMETQAALCAIALAVYAASFVRPLRQLAYYVLGGVPAAALILGYNWATLGSPLRFAYQYVYNPIFRGMHSGFFGVSVPRWSSLVAILFSSRGMLTQSPLLWFVPLGAWGMWRAARWRRECLLCLALGLAFIVYNAGYFLPLGGQSPGARFLIPVLPFVVVPLAFIPALPRPYSAVAGALAALAGLYGIGVCALITIVNPLAPEFVPDPLADYWLPLFRRGAILTNVGALRYGLRGLWSLAPLGVFLLCAMGVLTVAVAGRGPRGADRVAWAGVVGLLVIGYLMLAFPLDPLHLDAIPGIFRK